ncbi:hypothetical protein FSP39_004441 [Pinctada imbricata]|uniref:HTH CENPB-type domain-containing protein n=1 Tax=Pinctada imbricata TaxID=66713 RepID=A0AA88YHC0_PINIB|nr:hypothetical protein FSP39_004441 [Pinctada imbricata]
MPRNYIKKKTNAYEKEKLMEAVDMVRRGESIRGTAKQLNIPKSTIADAVKGKYKHPGEPGRKQVIPKDVEDRICRALIEAARQGIGISRQQVLRRVSDLCKRVGAPVKKLGKDWFEGFKSRHPEISIRKPEKLTTTRARMVNPAILKNYFDELNGIFENTGLGGLPTRIWNSDETGKQFEHDPVRVLAKKGSRNVLGRTTSNRTNVTIMGCVNAVGESMPPMFIVKGKTSRSLHGFNTEAAPEGSMWGFQEKGWMTDSLGEIWFRDIFLRHCGTERPQLLILDGHSSHETLAILEMALEENIIMLCLPPHSTHALQPLDRSVFGPLNSSYNTVCSDYLNENPLNSVTKWTFPGLFKEAWIQALSVANIVSGFRACGVFPFNPSAVPQDLIAPSAPSDVRIQEQPPLSHENNQETVSLSIASNQSQDSVPSSADTSSPSNVPTTVAVSPSQPQLPLDQPHVTASLICLNGESAPPVIEDPALLLQLITSGKCEIFSPDVSGVATIPMPDEQATPSQEAWTGAIDDLFTLKFINSPSSSSEVAHEKSSAKKRKGHRLLTSAEIIEEKRAAASKKEIKNNKKKAKNQK